MLAALLVLHGVSADAEAARKKMQFKRGTIAKHSVAGRHVHKVSAASQDLWSGGRPGLSSASALVMDQRSGELLYEKNAAAVLPIASITKLMTAMVVLDSVPNLAEGVTIGEADVDTLRGSRSRLAVGTVLTREDALLLALMSSENRAAHSLARHYPGGLSAFVAAMNQKAASLGMSDTRFEDPTGLSSGNVSSARDLARMVTAAHRYPLIRELTTTAEAAVELNGRTLGFHNTNPLVKSGSWQIGLSKTGFIQEAGKCLVMQASVADQPVVIVLLDSAGKMTRIGDANRLKRWMENGQVASRAGKVTS
jgi:D-alanyl-D-alanine endopeptidase (penicillin-binding protein 7)